MSSAGSHRFYVVAETFDWDWNGASSSCPVAELTVAICSPTFRRPILDGTGVGRFGNRDGGYARLQTNDLSRVALALRRPIFLYRRAISELTEMIRPPTNYRTGRGD